MPRRFVSQAVSDAVSQATKLPFLFFFPSTTSPPRPHLGRGAELSSRIHTDWACLTSLLPTRAVPFRRVDSLPAFSPPLDRNNNNNKPPGGRQGNAEEATRKQVLQTAVHRASVAQQHGCPQQKRQPPWCVTRCPRSTQTDTDRHAHTHTHTYTHTHTPNLPPSPRSVSRSPGLPPLTLCALPPWCGAVVR